MLGKREIERNKKLASKYKGIGYDVARNMFVVRVRCGRDLKGRPLYVQPIRRYNSIEKAIECLEIYEKMVREGMGRHKKVTFEIIKKKLDEEKKKLIEISRANPESREAKEGKAKIETLKKHSSVLDLISRGCPTLFVKDLRKIEKGEIQKAYEQMYRDGIQFKYGTKKVAKSTLNERFKRLKRIVGDNYGVDCELFRIKLITESRKDTNRQLSNNKDIYTMDELQKMYNEADTRAFFSNKKNNTDDRTLLLLTLLICTGARIGELLNISVDKVIHKDDKKGYVYENLDGEKETLKLENMYYIVIQGQRNDYTGGEATAKTAQSNRVIPIFEGLYDEIQRYVRKYGLSGKDKLFCSTYSGRKDVSLARNNIYPYIKKLQEKAGIEAVSGRANHAFRGNLITTFESVLKVRENTVRIFVGHIGRNDAHSGYLKIGGDPIALRQSALEFVVAQATYFYSVAKRFDVDTMLNLKKEYEYWLEKDVNMSEEQKRDEYISFVAKEDKRFFDLIKSLGYGITEWWERYDYNTNGVIHEAVEEYRHQPTSFRREVSLYDYLKEWMTEFHAEYDKKSQKDDEEYQLEREFYNSDDFKKDREFFSFEDVLLDIQDKYSVVYRKFNDYISSKHEKELGIY